MLLSKYLQALDVPRQHLFARLEFDGDLCISKHSINFNIRICMPIGKRILLAIVTKVSHYFLNQQMLESVSIFGCSSSKRKTFEQPIDNTNVKIIELRRLTEFAFYSF